MAARFNVMSSKNKSKCKNNCPGWGTPRNHHDFSVTGKHCKGPEEQDPDWDSNLDEKSPVKEEQMLAPVPGDKQDTLLQALFSLSLY